MVGIKSAPVIHLQAASEIRILPESVGHIHCRGKAPAVRIRPYSPLPVH
jgi:hypothetical protein